MPAREKLAGMDANQPILIHVAVHLGATLRKRWQRFTVPYPVTSGPGGVLCRQDTGRPVPEQDKVPVDYTGCAALLQLRAKHGGPVVLEFSTAPTEQQGSLTLDASGWVEMALSAAQTASLPYGAKANQWKDAFGGMHITFGNGDVFRHFDVALRLDSGSHCA